MLCTFSPPFFFRGRFLYPRLPRSPSLELPRRRGWRGLPLLVYKEAAGAATEQKQTRPRPLHTESSLLAAMETAGRELSDEAEREAMNSAANNFA